jgi:phosphate transport system substrate-binding protein
LFDAAFDRENAGVAIGQGFVTPTDAVYATDQQILQNVETGRQFSKDVTAFQIPTNLVGTLNIAGAATGSDYLTAATGGFVTQYPGVTLNQKYEGQPEGTRRLCNGEVDLITAFDPLSQEQQDNCAANNIPIETITLGSQAVVLLGHGDFLTCLTTAEVAAVWGTSLDSTMTNWNQVNANFPDLPLTLVAPPLGDREGDLLMIRSAGVDKPLRADAAETTSDPAYRTSAVGNVDGGMTYMSWQDYAALTPDVQTRATLVSIDGGNGCVAPSPETIADGTYILSRRVNLIVNRLSMARQEVQSALWYLASDDNYGLLEQSGYVGVDFSTLPDLRDWLQQTFVTAASDAAEAALRAAQATPEATVEATSESTPSAEATADATNESTPASESTAEAGG